MKSRLAVAICIVMICCASLGFAQTELVNDNFDGGINGTYLGPNWTGCGFFLGTYSELVYQNNQAGGGGNSSQECSVYTGYGAFPSDQYATATVVAPTPSSIAQAGVQLRQSVTPSSPESYIACGWNVQDFLSSGDYHYRIWSMAPNPPTGGPTSLFLSTISPATNDVIWCQVLGITVTMKVNGTTIATVTDTSGLTSGYPGLYYVDPNAGAPPSNDVIWDNFAAGAGPALVSLTITPSSATATAGSFVQFTGIATYADGTTANITNWSSSDTSVATIDTSGFAYAANPGTVTITGSTGLNSGTVTLTVVAAQGYTPLVNDSFAGPTGSYLGPNWTGCGFYAGSYSKLVYQNNQAGGGGYYSQECSAYTGYGAFPNDQYATATLVAPTPSSITQAGIQLRQSTTPSSPEFYIACGWNGQDFAADPHYRIWSLEPDPPTGGPTSLYLSSITPATNDVIWCQVVGTTVTMKLNGTTIATVTDISGVTSGYPGLYYLDPNGDIPPSNDVIWDNFVAGTALQTYTISGTISGAGGAGATVSLTGASTATATADGGGNYSFAGLTNGSYTVTPSSSGVVFTPASQNVTVNGGNATASFSSALQAYSIAGTISGAGGAGATVNLTGAATATATADGGGNYSFTGVTNGSYTVTPSNSGYGFTPSGQAVTISGANATANFNSAQTYSITGAISGAGGAGATVSLTGASTATATADGGGNYSLTGLANGSYTVTPSKSGYVFTPGSQAVTISGANATASFSSALQTYSIAGTISGAGGAGATVSLTGAATATATADGGGNYSFTGVTNGSYTVTPSNSGYGFTPSGQAVTISGANATANFNSAQTYSITGTISGAGGVGATVSLTGASTATATADGGGNYSFTGLANGSYTVTPSKSGYVFTPGSQAVTISGGNATASFSSALQTYSIAGTISGAGGAGATVSLTGASTATATADGGGNYTFPGLANGSYTVTPSNAGYTFTPTSHSVAVSGANVTGVNFTASGGTPKVALTPTSISFGNQQVGLASAPRTVTLKNPGTGVLTITGISFAGNNPVDFSQTNNCGTTLTPGASCAISVVFTPGSNGTRTASLLFADNAAGSPQSVALSGTGTSATINLSPTSINFGMVLDFSNSTAQSVKVQNTGSATLHISSIAITGTNAPDFSIPSKNCAATLAAGATCTVKVQFTPQAGGTRTATLSLVDDASGSPQTVSLSGTGSLVKVSPTSLSFAAKTVGTTGSAKNVILTNVGPDTLTISGVTITGTNPGDFSQTNNCSATLTANGSCTIAVRFKPTAIGARTATLRVDDSDPSSPTLVNLTGTGQ